MGALMAATAKRKPDAKSNRIAKSDKPFGEPLQRPAEGRVRPRNAKLPKRHRATDPDEFKTSMLNIRVRADLKTEASQALEKIGISLPEAVRVFLGRIVREQAFPFPLEVPNDETSKALRESMASDHKRHASAEEMFDELEIGSVQ